MLKENNSLRYGALPILTMPVELRQFVLGNCTNPSPYNTNSTGSFYDCADKNWNYTPDGSIRISDHWNFYTRGKVHCVTDVPNEKIYGKWVVARYCAEMGLYHVISSYSKDYTEFNKREDRIKNKFVAPDYSEIKQKRIQKLRQIQKQRAAEKRAERIKKGAAGKPGGIWVEINVNKWLGTGRRVRFGGTETIVGVITWESKTGNSICVNGKEYRAFNSYKELPRKPRVKK